MHVVMVTLFTVSGCIVFEILGIILLQSLLDHFFSPTAVCHYLLPFPPLSLSRSHLPPSSFCSLLPFFSLSLSPSFSSFSHSFPVPTPSIPFLSSHPGLHPAHSCSLHPARWSHSSNRGECNCYQSSDSKLEPSGRRYSDR